MVGILNLTFLNLIIYFQTDISIQKNIEVQQINREVKLRINQSTNELFGYFLSINRE
ncbi:hypothetical protein TTHERM_000794369 (macronuclear) [Tetrahymena thermophila SB210]|uniref:Transmembrane protein n=1 Tax=Tetrahymena thermophila (strain SB210) TaxID=312017 RepID=W7X9U2_TETTS|nr:hypothetical protein TTHERM_000794369 [Tetrahymena thermophila SB210]EWS73173.1 hypothetical protein TTHERM_000794369 [Tetrahymena thermophila SB210]|eukprot:XP_012654293.1 hypothetical protein TTHERM_000794369 [Tetrahymena thermophila SB210]